MVRAQLYFVPLLVLLVVKPLFAFTTELHLSSDFVHTLDVSCAQTDGEICQQLCSHPDFCELELKTCRDCLGTSSLVLRDVFLELDKWYVPTESDLLLDEEALAAVVDLLRTRNIMAVKAESAYNFYTRVESWKVKQVFVDLCRHSSVNFEKFTWEDVTLIISLDRYGRPEKISNVFCQNQNQTQVFGVRRLEESQFRIGVIP